MVDAPALGSGLIRTAGWAATALGGQEAVVLLLGEPVPPQPAALLMRLPVLPRVNPAIRTDGLAWLAYRFG
jgi:hypothetical protein